MKKIRNYTSGVPVDRSVSQIEAKLVAAGATNIVKMYENQQLAGLVFDLNADGKSFPIRLPARVEQVHEALDSRDFAQSQRTAWKIMLDWIDLQLTLIQLNQAEPLEIFMPYIYDGRSKQTVYELMKANEFKMLPQPKEPRP